MGSNEYNILPSQIPTYPNHFIGPRFNPTFDGRYARATTTDPYLNNLFDIVNDTQSRLEYNADRNDRADGYDPNWAFYQNNILPQMDDASKTYRDAGGGKGGTSEQSTGGGSSEQSGGGPGLGDIALHTAGGAAVGAAIGSVVPVIGTGIGAAVGGLIGAISSFF